MLCIGVSEQNESEAIGYQEEGRVHTAYKAMMTVAPSTTIALSSHDLAEIDRFHNAWCEENAVDKDDPRSIEVASALIDWYASDRAYRSTSMQHHMPELPESERIKTLLTQMT